MFAKRFSRALAVVVTASLLTAMVASANDKLTADADLATSDADRSYTNTSLAEGSTATFSFSLYVRVQPGGNEPTYPIDIELDSRPSWVAVHPDTTFPITIDGVGTANAELVQFIATGQAEETTGTITFKAYAGGTNTELSQSLINTADSTFTVTVSPPTVTPPSNTAPVVTVTGVEDGASYEFGSVPAAGCDVEDAEDGNSSFAAQLSAITGTYSSYGLGSQTASCSYTDDGGLSDSDSATYSIVDTTGPVVTAPGDLSSFEGNTTGGATKASVLAALGAASATDAAFGDVSASLTNNAPTTFPLGTTTVTFSAQDPLGNLGSDTVDVTVVDTTAPTINGMPNNISTTTMNAAGKVVTWTAPTATDIVDSSVAVNCLPASGSTFAIGTTTVTCSATDDSNNTAQRSFTVTVGLLTAIWKEPINGPSVVNVAKAGRVIPVKVEVFLNGSENRNTGAVTFKLWKSTACTAGAQDTVEAFLAVGEAAGGDAFVWNTDGDFYQYNLKTPTTAGCYSGEVLLNGERAGYFLINATK